MGRSRAIATAFAVGIAITACAAPASSGGAEGAAEVTTGAASISPVAGGADWPTYHGDNARTGYVAAGPDPVSPGIAWQARLDGQVYASPLVVRGLVVAATEAGGLYGLDAATGGVRWHTTLAAPARADDLPCGNIHPTVGITGTPAYDAASGLVFAVVTTTGGRHVLFAVDPATGQIRSQRDADAPGSDPAPHLERGALLVANGTVYIPYGGNFGDCGRYLGRVVGLPTTGDRPATAYAVPTTREAGMWSPPGPSALPGGDLLVTTGNGEATGDTWDSSDSILRLSADLRQRDGFAPAGWAEENSVDADLGSTGPVLLPGAKRVIAAGKGGEVYLADVDRLGGVGGQLAKLDGCHSYGGTAVVPGPVAFLPCTDGVLQVLVGPGDTLRRGWQATRSATGSPVVVGTTVWSVTGSTLVGLDAATGQQRARLDVGSASRFATPAVSGKALYVPTNAGITAVAISR